MRFRNPKSYLKNLVVPGSHERWPPTNKMEPRGAKYSIKTVRRCQNNRSALGQKRAGAVAGYLSKQGLAEERIATSSRGELEATGEDQSGWARDRRVEIFLAE